MGLLTLSGCASLEDVDRDKLNHPAMDLKQTQTPSLGTPYTSLNSFREAAAGGGCGSCAK
ncbi:MAG: hypothetical protein IPM57_10990 [Oligoflexia bacterium]|nr:hypothetical protein [Oligoflexia bacterium]